MVISPQGPQLSQEGGGGTGPLASEFSSRRIVGSSLTEAAA